MRNKTKNKKLKAKYNKWYKYIESVKHTETSKNG